MQPADLDVWNFLNVDALISQLGWEAEPASAVPALPEPAVISGSDNGSGSGRDRDRDRDSGLEAFFAEALPASAPRAPSSPSAASSAKGERTSTKRGPSIAPLKVIAPATRRIAETPPPSPSPPPPPPSQPPLMIPALSVPKVPAAANAAPGRQVHFFPPLPVPRHRKVPKAIPIPVKKTGSTHPGASSPHASPPSWHRTSLGKKGVSLETIEKVRLIILEKIKNRREMVESTGPTRPQHGVRKRPADHDPEQYFEYFGSAGLEASPTMGSAPMAAKRSILPRDQAHSATSAMATPAPFLPMLSFDPFSLLEGLQVRAERNEFVASPTSMGSNKSQDEDWPTFNAHLTSLGDAFGQPTLMEGLFGGAELPRLEDFFA